MAGSIAGRVMPLPKGNYDPTEIYGTLDFVSHNNQLWMCTKQNTQGIEPTLANTNNWMFVISGTDASDYYSKVETDQRYAQLSSVVDTTVKANSWTGSAAPYTNTVTVAGVTLNNNIEVTVDMATITDAQLEAYVDANIQRVTQGANSITLYAYDDKPTIDLPIRVIVRRDLL